MNRTSIRLAAGLLESPAGAAPLFKAYHSSRGNPDPEQVREFWRRCRAGVPASGNPGIPTEVLALLHIRADGPVSKRSVFDWLCDQSDFDRDTFASILDYLNRRGFIRSDYVGGYYTCTRAGGAWFDAGEDERRRGSR